MGKSCVRFRKLRDLELDVIGAAIRGVSARKFIDDYESVIKTVRRRRARSASVKVSLSGQSA